MSKRMFTTIIVSLALSLLLHSIIIAAVSGTGAFALIPVLTAKPLTALLISEKPSVRRIELNNKSAGPSATKSGSPDQDAKQAADQGGKAPEPQSQEQMQDKTVAIPEDESAPEKADTVPPVISDTNPPPAETPAASASQGTDKPPDAAEARAPIMKSTREKLSYSIYWFGIYVGKAELEAVNNGGSVTITSRVHSAPVISAFYTVDDYSESRIVGGVPVNFRIRQHEGKYRSDKETVFDLDNRHVTFNDYIKRTKDDYTVKGGELWDLISGFYYMRTQPVEVGKTIYIDIFDSKKFFQAEVSVIGKERIKSASNEEVDTVKVKPVLKSEGLFQNKGDILIWLTDDDNKTPVKIETKVPIGKVVAVLVSATGE